MSLEEHIQMEERAAKTRRSYEYEEAKKAYRDQIPLQAIGVAGAGMVGGNAEATAGPAGPDVHWLLANRRNQLLREAEAIQALIDALPSKLPHAAAQALRTLVLK